MYDAIAIPLVAAAKYCGQILIYIALKWFSLAAGIAVFLTLYSPNLSLWKTSVLLLICLISGMYGFVYFVSKEIDALQALGKALKREKEGK